MEGKPEQFEFRNIKLRVTIVVVVMVALITKMMMMIYKTFETCPKC